MKYILIVAFSSLLTFNLIAQERSYLSLELAGSGGFASFNYEKSIYNIVSTSFYLRGGFSLTPIDSNNGVVLIFPLMLHTTTGTQQHKFDFGIGQSISVTTKGSLFILAPLSFGYRYLPKSNSHYWRIAYTPIVSYLLSFQWQHWAGVTYGYRL